MRVLCAVFPSLCLCCSHLLALHGKHTIHHPETLINKPETTPYTHTHTHTHTHTQTEMQRLRLHATHNLQQSLICTCCQQHRQTQVQETQKNKREGGENRDE